LSQLARELDGFTRVCPRYPFTSTGLRNYFRIFFPIDMTFGTGSPTFKHTNNPHFHYSLLNHHKLQVKSTFFLVKYHDFHGFQWISMAKNIIAGAWDVAQELLGRFYGRLLALKGDAGSLEEMGDGRWFMWFMWYGWVITKMMEVGPATQFLRTYETRLTDHLLRMMEGHVPWIPSMDWMMMLMVVMNVMMVMALYCHTEFGVRSV